MKGCIIAAGAVAGLTVAGALAGLPLWLALMFALGMVWAVVSMYEDTEGGA